MDMLNWKAPDLNRRPAMEPRPGVANKLMQVKAHASE